MLRRFTRTRWIAALSAVTALAVAGAAIAYFTASGSGTGRATVGTVTSSDLVLKGDVASGSFLFPGGDAVTVPITVQNNSKAPVNLAAVKLTNVAADSDHAGCVVSAFTMDPVPVNATAAPGATIGPFNGALKMNDTGANQDACQGAALTLTFASTAGS